MELKIRRGISYLLGLFILAIGITLTIVSQLGTGAWDALSVGLASITGLTVGNWVILVGIILIIVNAILQKARPDFLAIITVVLLGYFIDFWLLFVFRDVGFEGFAIQLAILLIGVVTMGLGIATYLQGKFAVIPIDGFMFTLQKLFGFKLMVAKTTAELVALVLAFFVGGPIGIGTIIVTLLIGPLIQFFFPKIEHLVEGKVITIK
ncbi:YczE/YyaS/YitT family protein [Bacillus sp. FJAT-45350]|uniref:YczE/YyaS/YitT family protein n=1 Tax=Bacillus sp. FJAT-45350 TaxID=2011014 RepID=UPI000BB77F8E|nr:membrane protein [Bacillus sp. FJAT-45350]